MDELYTKLQKQSLMNYGTMVLDRKKNADARDERLRVCVAELGTRILSESVEKMITASDKGYFSCRLFECKADEKWSHEYRTVFLLRGPSRWYNPVSFFETKNIVGIETYLQEQLKPIEVHMKYDRHSRTHFVEASWKTFT